MLGFHDSEELDRPDLNKCPECRCFFDGDNCPLCGKICPEEMRAGNRAKVKPKKKRRDPYAGRTVFVAWYHSWVCIILALLFSPLIGIILLATSPHKKSQKIAVIAIGVAWLLLTSVGIGSIINLFDRPVNTFISREEYIERCESIEGEEFYRNAESYKKDYLKMTLTVKEKTFDYEGLYAEEKYTDYYICSTEDGFEILVRSCSRDGDHNFRAGDKITVYGQGGGNRTIYNEEFVPMIAPCLNGAYIVLN
jgi:hypothetical protein